MTSKRKLRQVIEEYDREHARLHKLTGEPLVPQRVGTEVRLVCGSCWHVVDAHHEYQLWEMKTVAECPCPKGERYSSFQSGWTHFDSKHEWITHKWPGVGKKCPKCGKGLHEVQP